jgi:hypothetical protein
MSSAAKKEERVGKVVAVVESCLHDIAGEHDTPFTMAPAMLEFLADVQRALLRVGHERLLVFMGRKERKERKEHSDD